MVFTPAVLLLIVLRPLLEKTCMIKYHNGIIALTKNEREKSGDSRSVGSTRLNL